MKWPWVSRRKFDNVREKLDWFQKRLKEGTTYSIKLQDEITAREGSVDFWRDAYEKDHEEKEYWKNVVDFWRDAYKKDHEEKEHWKTIATHQAQEEKAADTITVVNFAREAERRQPGAAFVPEMRPMPESRISICNTVDTGRLVGKAVPSGAASRGK